MTARAGGGGSGAFCPRTGRWNTRDWEEENWDATTGASMAKYLAAITYTAEGLKGLMAKGGTARVEASREFVASAGGSLESFYFALGSDDAYIVCDLPDNVAAAATAISAGATGMVVNRMVPLLTAEEVDQAAATKLSYQAPGS
jgi:uncharacterized protein with GYD domain